VHGTAELHPRSSIPLLPRRSPRRGQ
jgi:hypothetical protein